MMRLSIIIPVFNVEDYVTRCVESCLNQDIPLEDYEIILVNDGSEDSSLRIINDLASRYDNITVFTQENKGLSVTRNRGFSASRGEYVWFIDSDDFIEENCLGRLLLEAKGMDVVAFGCKEFTIEGDPICQMSYGIANGTMTGPQFIVGVNSDFLHGVPFYLFRRAFLNENHLEFYPGIFHEDSEFTPRVLSCASKLFVSEGKYYHRIQRSGSITHVVNTKRIYDIVFVAKRLHEFIHNADLEANERKAMLRIIPRLLNSSLTLVLESSEDNKKDFNRFFYQNKLFKLYFGSHDFRYLVEGILLFLFQKMSVDFYKFVKR